MSEWSNSASLSGSEGELVSVRVAVEPKELEDLLETLAGIAFPINPEIHHPSANGTSNHQCVVEFPAYAGQLKQVRNALGQAGFPPGVLDTRSMLEEIGYHAVVA